MHGVYCPGDVHWARLEASALGSLIAACTAWKRREERPKIQKHSEDRELNQATSTLDPVK